jgi:hypothetical protein
VLTTSTFLVSGAILGGVGSREHGLAVIDYTRYGLASPDAIKRWPTGAIVWVEGAQQFGARRAQLQGAVA